MGKAADVFSGIPEDSLVPVRECYKEQDFQKTWNELPERLLVIITIESNAERPGIFIKGLQHHVNGMTQQPLPLLSQTILCRIQTLDPADKWYLNCQTLHSTRGRAESLHRRL